MNNEFFEVFNKYKNKLFDYKTHSYFESIYRFLAILIFPLSKKSSINEKMKYNINIFNSVELFLPKITKANSKIFFIIIELFS